MIKHPHPFVINFELNLNRSSLLGNNFPSIIFFNISTVELEFKNLNLSIQRNKINDLKNQFQRLIKKETYWRQKEITLNKIRWKNNSFSNVTISGNNNKLIKDWIRPLQKSLTIETENKFINTLGREKYFNDYLHQSLKKLDNLNLSDEYLRIFYEFSKKYNEYNKLDENQRKRLIIDTRKNLYKLGKTLEIESSNNICLLYTSPSPRD